MMRWVALAVLACNLCLKSECQQVHDSSVFHPSQYPANNFSVTQRDIPLGETTVRIIQAKGRGFAQAPAYCSAWIEVRRGNAVVKRLSFLDIEPVGYSFGLFLPLRQPLPNALVIMKLGDYDGRMIIVSNDGSVANLPGGLYFATDDRRFLVGIHMRDDSGLVVVDGFSRSVILDDDSPRAGGDIGDFYQDRRGYFFTLDGEPTDSIYRLDLQDRKVLKEKSGDLIHAKKINFDFSPVGMPDCTTK